MITVNFDGKIPVVEGTTFGKNRIVIGAKRDNKSRTVRFVFDSIVDGIDLTGASAFLHFEGIAPFSIASNVQAVEDKITIDYIIEQPLTDVAGYSGASIQFAKADETIWSTLDMIFVIQERTDSSGEIPAADAPDILAQVQASAAAVAISEEKAEASATSANQSALTSTNNLYETAQDAEESALNATTATNAKNIAVQAKDDAVAIKNELLSQKGLANGLASTDENNKVIQTALNSDNLNGHSDTYFATAQQVIDLDTKANTKIELLSYSQDGYKLATTKNGVSSNIPLVGLFTGATFDGITGKLTFNVSNGSDIVVNIPVDKFVSSGHYDTETECIVLVMTDGSTIDIPASSLIDVYTGNASSTANVIVGSDNKITVNVKSSATGDNVLQIKTDGLYIPPTDLSAYKTKTENDALYLSIGATAVNATKAYGKLESELNVANADTADKLTTARNISINGAVSGNANFDGSANIEINLSHNNIPFETAVITSDAYTWDTSVNRFLVINNTNPVQVTLTNLTNGFIGVLHVYGNKLDEAFLTTQGFELKAPYTYIDAVDADDAYRYVLTYDSVKKHISRQVI